MLVAHSAFNAEWAIEGPDAPSFLGPSWRIARDGAIYGTTTKGVYKLN